MRGGIGSIAKIAEGWLNTTHLLYMVTKWGSNISKGAQSSGINGGYHRLRACRDPSHCTRTHVECNRMSHDFSIAKNRLKRHHTVEIGKRESPRWCPSISISCSRDRSEMREMCTEVFTGISCCLKGSLAKFQVVIYFSGIQLNDRQPRLLWIGAWSPRPTAVKKKGYEMIRVKDFSCSGAIGIDGYCKR